MILYLMYYKSTTSFKTNRSLMFLNVHFKYQQIFAYANIWLLLWRKRQLIFKTFNDKAFL